MEKLTTETEYILF